jgi:hypothetical protein
MSGSALGMPPTHQQQRTQLLMFPGTDHVAMIMTIKIVITQRAAGQQSYPIADGELIVAVAQDLAGAGLGIAV